MTEPALVTRAVQELNFLTTVLQVGRPENDRSALGDQGTGVTILSGFLGAGKTTLLRQILSGDHGRRVAVIVNDFGAVNLDAAEIAREHGGVVELTNGCSCCAMGAEFTAALKQVLDVIDPPQHIMVEASGLSDPAALATLAAGVGGCGAVGVVTLIDAHSAKALESLPTAHLFTRQIDVAHLIVVTKTGDLPEAQARMLIDDLAQRFPGRRILPDVALDPAMTFSAEVHGARPMPSAMQHDLSSVVTHELLVKRSWKLDELTRHLGAMPDGILRLKGSVPLGEGGFAALQCVGKRFEITPTDAPVRGETLILIGLRESQPVWSGWAARF